MIRLKTPVIVEGKYDKIRLSNIIDAPIFTTDGFRIFKDKEKMEFFRAVAEKSGIIILTDSDSAGQMIRNHLKKAIGDTHIYNVYLPEILGKEKRKTKPSKEGFLGVEGMTQQALEHALLRSGITGEQTTQKREKQITKTHLFTLGLSGGKNSSLLRYKLSKYLNLPQGLSANAFLDCLNAVYDYNDFIKAVQTWQKNRQDADKK